MVRGKFQLTKIAQVSWSETARELTFNAVSNDGTPENERFHRYTPTGSISMIVDNPSAIEKFELGKSYYVDFTPVT